LLNCWSQSPWFVEFGDEVGVHDVLEDDAVVDHVVVDHVVVDGVEDEDDGDDEQAMEQKCLDSEAKDYDELMLKMALNLELGSAAT
jgi:hypothetical protein